MIIKQNETRRNDFWVFGYGSLMWRPGFAHVETVRARLHGFRRSLCIYSHVHRGTPDCPGLVLGLDAGGSCLGMAFRVPGDMTDEVMLYLREREMSTNVYHEKQLRLRLADGREVKAVTYVADRRHVQYAGSLTTEDAASIVAAAHGEAGANCDYVTNTLTHLRQMRVRDLALENIGELILKKAGQSASGSI
ncbi:gamma-glutamylcyclotransferase [Brucella sp. BE17]|uniref:gamma-glutamylcyclotransferase n=1 Tax=Brucella sp. BE17 TaxID=3142977 RepID=UPI0031BB9721